ncbi:MAG: L-threonylcarbamoyladenylate synthase, partial [Anaerolineae bacterium]|nr:L-threonylcarbamoyladenylate synthase [Anaerolineae bacterium]
QRDCSGLPCSTIAALVHTQCRIANETAIREAAAIIRRGGLVAFPTETVYGLGANALDPHAVARIYAAKQRALNDPLIVHVADAAQAEALLDRARLSASQWTQAQTLMQRFWPGPLTLVLWRSGVVPPNVSAGLDTLAVRCPSHPVASALIRASGVPIAAPSANRFGHVSPTTAQHVLDDLDGRIDLVLDGGPTAIGVESTVLDLTTDPPRILRPGGLPREQIEQALDKPVASGPAYVGDSEPAASPGLLARHYAPRARLIVCADEVDLLARHAALLQQGKQVAALLLRRHTQAQAVVHPHFVLGETPEEVARSLYAGLRALDAQAVDVILTVRIEGGGLNEAIADRLRRASAHITESAPAAAQ